MSKLWIAVFYSKGEQSEWTSIVTIKKEAQGIHQENIDNGYIPVKRPNVKLAMPNSCQLEPNQCTIFSADEYYDGA